MRARRTSLVTGWMLLLLLLQIGSACERRPLEDQEEPPLNYAEIQVVFDWSLAGMSPTGMTALFYPEDGSKPIIHKTGDLTSSVRLLKGTYNVVGFNYSFDEFDVIRFRGIDKYETVEAYVTTAPPVVSEISTFDNPVNHPDIFATCHREGFEVTEEMVAYTTQVRNRAAGRIVKASEPEIPMRIVLRPVRVVAPGYVKVHLKGLNYIRSARGVLTGLSESVFLSTGKGSPVSCSVPFEFSPPVYYAESKVNGTVSGSFTTFGMIPVDGNAATRAEHKYSFLFSAVLVDKDKTHFEQLFDVTGKIEQRVDVNLNIILRLNLELGQSPNPEEDNTPTIVVPEVKPEDGGAFNVNVGDWGEEENVYL